MVQTKVATCCYCGTRAALVLRGDRSHELACGSCGAPLTRLKMFPAERTRGAGTGGAPAASTAQAAPRQGFGLPHRPPNLSPAARESQQVRSRPTKKRGKSLKRKIVSGLWDVIEDLFD